MNTIILISVLLLAPSAVAITPRRRARVDVPKASKIKKELAASTKKHVPIAGQREALLLKDAKMLAKTMIKQLPASRHGEAGEAVAQAFLDEAKKQGV